MKLIDLFAGIGGFSLGLGRAGFETVCHVEIDKNCQTVLGNHWPDVPGLSDVRDCGAHNLPSADVITFGSPCQDFSIAGKRAGLKGERSGLISEAIRIVEECRPAFAVWENVPGALSSNSGRDFRSVLVALRNIGARDIAWRTLDARYFGVPQRRRRVFLIADFRGERAAEILFEPEGGGGHSPAGGSAGEDFAAPLTARTHKGGFTDLLNDNIIAAPVRAAPPSQHGGGSCPTPGHFVVDVRNRAESDSVSPPLQSKSTGGQSLNFQPVVVSALTKNGVGATGADDNQAPAGHIIAFAERTRPEGVNLEYQENMSYALLNPGAGSRTQDRNIAGNFGVRRLTPTECERMQGFPDGWAEELSDTARYRALGNAVCVPVVEWIAHRILAASQEEGRA